MLLVSYQYLAIYQYIIIIRVKNQVKLFIVTITLRKINT